METKSKDQIEKQVEAYLNKTSNHLFLLDNGYLLKVITLSDEGNLYYATIMIKKDQVHLTVQPMVTDNQIRWYGNNTANVIKKSIFPQYYKAKSIPYFKRMRTLVSEIKSEINLDNSKNKSLIEKIKTRVIELELIKE